MVDDEKKRKTSPLWVMIMATLVGGVPFMMIGMKLGGGLGATVGLLAGYLVVAWVLREYVCRPDWQEKKKPE